MKLYWLLFGFLLVLMACNTQPTPPKVVRIEVSPSALLLSKAGESQTLTAKAFDAQGNEVKASFAWSSTRLAEVTVDATGKVTAMGDLGSAQVMAEAEGVKSLPATVLIAQPVSGAVLVADNQVLGQPQESVPDQEPTVGSQYKVLLNAAQTPGAIVLSSGSQPIAGKVVSSTPSGSGFEVVIERRPVTEVFNRISVRLQGSLAEVQPSFTGLTQPSQVQTLPDGRLRLSYAPSSAIAPQLEKERKIGPFNCKLKVGIAPSDAGIAIEIRRDLNYDLVLDTEFFTVKQFRAKIEGSLGVSAAGKLEFGALGEVNLTCKATVFRLPIPVSGPAALFISPVAPLGLKFSATGELKSTFLGIGLDGEAKLDATVGIDYTPEKGWVNLSSFETVAKDVTPKLLSLANSPLEFGGKLGFQGTMGIGVGNTVAALEILEGASGPVLEANLKPSSAQVIADDPSTYKLNWKTELGAGEDLKKILKRVLPDDVVENLSLVSLSLVADDEFASSPKADGEITVNRQSFKTGDKLTFKVPLDPANLNFLPFLYNVEAVKIYRKNGSGTVSEVASQTAKDDQKDFTLEWVATEDGTTTDNFFAFVETILLPFAHLKLGVVTAQNLLRGRSNRFLVGAFMAGIDPPCGSGQQQDSVIGASIGVALDCTYPNFAATVRSSILSTVTKGMLRGGFSYTGTRDKLYRGGGYTSIHGGDSIIIDAPGLTGTQGTFTAKVELAGSMSASGCSSGIYAGAEAKFSFWIDYHPSVGVVGSRILDEKGKIDSCDAKTGLSLPITINTVAATFTYGTPFELSYFITAEAVGVVLYDFAKNEHLKAAASQIEFGYRWLGMEGLPANATVESGSGIDWSKAAP